MAQIINADDGSVSGSAGLKSSSDGTAVLTLQTKGTDALTVNASQNVGIGTSSPAYKLDVSGSVRLKTGATGTPVIVSTGSDSQGTLRFGSTSTEYSINSGADYLAMIFNTNGSERARIDSSGNFGIGTASPGYRLHVVTSGTNDIGFFGTSSGGGGRIAFSDGNSGTAASVPRIGANANDLLFYTNTSGNNATERARITSGGTFLIGTTSTVVSGSETCGISGGVGLGVRSTGGTSSFAGAFWNEAASGDNVLIRFYTEAAGTERGTITYNRGAGQVAYNVTSDVRLKDNIADAVDAGSKVDALQVRQFDWKETGNHVDYGFVAQELDAIAPQAVSKPDDEEAMWSVDYSKLVPMLVKEIQSLRARVAQLESK